MIYREVYEYIDFVIRYVCVRTGAPDMGSNHQELLERIMERNPQIYRMLMEFVDAYHRWLEFSDKLIQEGKAARENAQDAQKLLDLIQARDTTREQLRVAVLALPPEK